jgi:hypothetical protein
MNRGKAIYLCLFGFLLGCGAEATGPPSITPEQRQSIKQNLAQLQARVTAEVPEGLYVSLRNTHLEVLEGGGAIECIPRTRRDIQDFGVASEAVAKAFLETAEFEAFKQWLREALSPNTPSPRRGEYGPLTLTLSRAPLRLVFSQTPPVEEP